MNLTTSQDKVLSYLRQFGKTTLHDVELADILALGYGSTVSHALKKLERYKLISVDVVASSRMITITDLGNRHLIIDEELKGKRK